MAARNEKREDGVVTVADVLSLEQLVIAEVDVVAGHEHLGRDVSWVHAGEIADIARFLQGGELLLTAGTGIGAHPREQRAYVDALHEAGASALVLELGRAFRTVPEGLRERAAQHGLPLATLRRTVPFAEVTRAVHAWIIGRQYAMQSRAERMALEFNDLLLSGAGIPQILHKVHEVTGRPALLEDAAHQLVDYAGEASDLDAIVDAWSEHSRFGHREAETPDAHGAHRTPTCAWASITLHDEEWGRVHIISPSGASKLDVLAADRASSALGLALLNNRHNARLAERNRADLLEEVERHAPEDPAAFLRQARSLGADFRERDLVAVKLSAPDEQLPELSASAVRAAESSGLPMLASAASGQCRLLVGFPVGGDTAAGARSLAEALLAAQGESAHDVVVGLSGAATVSALPRAFHEADECLRFARVSDARGVLEHSMLGLHLLLASLIDRAELATFVERELGALLDHDAQSRNPLLPTLRALLAHDSNRAEAARALHLERRSLYYRIERIEQILGQSLAEHDVKLGLSVALRALSLIEDRSPTRRAG